MRGFAAHLVHTKFAIGSQPTSRPPDNPQPTAKRPSFAWPHSLRERWAAKRPTTCEASGAKRSFAEGASPPRPTFGGAPLPHEKEGRHEMARRAISWRPVCGAATTPFAPKGRTPLPGEARNTCEAKRARASEGGALASLCSLRTLKKIVGRRPTPLRGVSLREAKARGAEGPPIGAKPRSLRRRRRPLRPPAEHMPASPAYLRPKAEGPFASGEGCRLRRQDFCFAKGERSSPRLRRVPPAELRSAKIRGGRMLSSRPFCAQGWPRSGHCCTKCAIRQHFGGENVVERTIFANKLSREGYFRPYFTAKWLKRANFLKLSRIICHKLLQNKPLKPIMCQNILQNGHLTPHLPKLLREDVKLWPNIARQLKLLRGIISHIALKLSHKMALNIKLLQLSSKLAIKSVFSNKIMIKSGPFTCYFTSGHQIVYMFLEKFS